MGNLNLQKHKDDNMEYFETKKLLRRRKLMKNFVFMALSFLASSCCSLDETITIGHYDNPQKALLVIDMQIDYIDEDGKFPIEKNQINGLIKTVNNIIDDLQGNNFQIIYIRRLFRKNDIGNVFRNFAAIEETAGVEIDPRINVVSDNIFDKYTPSAFSNKRFENFLIRNQINELYVCGVMADECVYETALSAFNSGYIVNYYANAVGSLSKKNIENAVKKLKSKGVNIIEY
jgi:nicotinamidase-related amidase